MVDVQGFLVNRLTGEFRTSWASADPLGVVDLATFDYSDDLLAAAGLHRDQFAELVAPGAVIGAVADEAAKATGLPPGAARSSPASGTASQRSSDVASPNQERPT